MSMHGRIYVEKNLFMDKARLRQMELHHKQLEEIKESKNNRLRENAKSTDQQMKNKSIWKIINHGFNEHGKLYPLKFIFTVEHQKAISRDNKKLLLKLVDISRGRQVNPDMRNSTDNSMLGYSRLSGAK